MHKGRFKSQEFKWYFFHLQLLRCSFPQAWDKYESLVRSCRCQSACTQTVSSYLHFSHVILTNIHFLFISRVFLPQGSVSVSRGPQKAIKRGPRVIPTAQQTAITYFTLSKLVPFIGPTTVGLWRTLILIWPYISNLPLFSESPQFANSHFLWLNDFHKLLLIFLSKL